MSDGVYQYSKESQKNKSQTGFKRESQGGLGLALCPSGVSEPL